MSEELGSTERQNLVCLALLSLVFLLTYTTSMVVSEIYLGQDNLLHFVLVKYLGSTVVTCVTQKPTHPSTSQPTSVGYSVCQP